MRIRAATVALACFLLSSNAALAVQGFFELGEVAPPDDLYFPRLYFSSQAHAVSADGQVVVGEAIHITQYFSVEEAFRWEDGVMRGLANHIPYHDRSLARGVSGDGRVVSTTIYTWGTGGPFGNGGGVVWYEDDVLTPVGDLPGGATWSGMAGIDAAGSVVVGFSPDAVTDRAIRWDAGTLTTLGTGLGWSYASGVDPSGSTVVGYQSNQLEYFAMRWDGLVGTPLPDPPQGDFGSNAREISADGSVIVGWSRQSAGNQAARWDASGATLLGTLPGYLASQAVDVSGDGSIVIGYSSGSYPAEIAFIWDPVNGMRPLRDVLVNEFGFDLAGWTLQRAESISEDGTVIVGTGINPQGRQRGWIAKLAGNGAPACSNMVDDDGDGLVDHPSDPGCASVLDGDEHLHVGECDDGLDNDDDGDVDHPADAACESLAGAREGFQCDDGRDNDGDGLIDWDGGSGGSPDPGCQDARDGLEGRVRCGLGYELAPLLVALLALRRRRPV
jgi:probable HAF family extracellular repeat protein